MTWRFCPRTHVGRSRSAMCGASSGAAPGPRIWITGPGLIRPRPDRAQATARHDPGPPRSPASLCGIDVGDSPAVPLQRCGPARACGPGLTGPTITGEEVALAAGGARGRRAGLSRALQERRKWRGACPFFFQPSPFSPRSAGGGVMGPARAGARGRGLRRPACTELRRGRALCV